MDFISLGIAGEGNGKIATVVEDFKLCWWRLAGRLRIFCCLCLHSCVTWAWPRGCCDALDQVAELKGAMRALRVAKD